MIPYHPAGEGGHGSQRLGLPAHLVSILPRVLRRDNVESTISRSGGLRRDRHHGLRGRRSDTAAVGSRAATLRAQRRDRFTPQTLLLLLPGLIALVVFLFLPLINVALESVRPYVPGKIGGARDVPFTLENYALLLHPVYIGYLGKMIWCASMATLIALVAAYPIAYVVARTRVRFVRVSLIGLLVGLLFLSALVRVYSLELSFGTVGLGRTLAGLMGVTPNSRTYAEFLVILGLAHHSIPLAALLMTGTIQNINPHLVEAGQTLGAPLWRAHSRSHYR